MKHIQDLNHRLCKKEHDEFDDTINSDWPFKNGEEYFKERIENGCALIAVINDKHVGYLVGGIVSVEYYRKVKIVAELENMFVDDRFRNMKIGTKLCEKFSEWCKNNKVSRIKTVVSAGNVKGQNFYRKSGFKDYSISFEKEID